MHLLLLRGLEQQRYSCAELLEVIVRDTQPLAWQHEPPLTLTEATDHILKNAFRPTAERKVGVELEWLVFDPQQPRHIVQLPTIRGILSGLKEPLPGGSVTAIEPGGQVELVSAPAVDLVSCLEAVSSDLAQLRARFMAGGLHLSGAGLDPLRMGDFVRTDVARYKALVQLAPAEDPQLGQAATNTASVQINVDCGDDSSNWRGYQARWRLLHKLGPILTAAFANSPYRSPGIPTGVLSTRQLARFNHFPERTGAPDLDADATHEWLKFVLDADVLFFRTPTWPWLIPNSPVTMREWLQGAGPRPATLDDLIYHISTLYPPIRARGYYELRMIDALPTDYWMVPTVLVNVLLDDERAFESAMAILTPLYQYEDLATVWKRAVHSGPTDNDIGDASLAIFDVAERALARAGVTGRPREVFKDFVRRYPARFRCPAHDLLLHGPESVLNQVGMGRRGMAGTGLAWDLGTPEPV